MKVSFKGIYDLRFPTYNTDKQIDDVKQKLDVYVESNNVDKFISVHKLFDSDSLNAKKNKSLLRVITAVDNPNLIVNMLSTVNENLASQYINKTRIELLVNTNEK